MSSRDHSGIPLSHASDGIGYKLLELPPDLLASLESDDPPVLTLESSATSAVLKHGSKTWGLRQNNTSNALMLLVPSTNPECSSSEVSQAGLKVFATVHDTIELVTETSSKGAPAAKGKWHERFARGK